MRRTALAALLLAIVGTLGCENGKTTDPKDLAPLSATDLEEIKARDAQIEEEERGDVVVVKGKGGKSKGKGASR
jgi:phage FluMu protein gp41